jgi:hypothetical protein
MVVLKVGLSCESLVLCTSGKIYRLSAFHFKISYNIYTPLYIPEKKKVELHPSYQNLVVTLDLVSRPRTLSLTLSITLLRLRTRTRVLALALTYLFSPSRTRSHPRFLTLVIAFPRSHLLAFCLSPSHIAYYVKFNYYLITHIIGRVTHPLAPQVVFLF